jgi:hypothetical protein
LAANGLIGINSTHLVGSVNDIDGRFRRAFHRAVQILHGLLENSFRGFGAFFRVTARLLATVSSWTVPPLALDAS